MRVSWRRVEDLRACARLYTQALGATRPVPHDADQARPPKQYVIALPLAAFVPVSAVYAQPGQDRRHTDRGGCRRCPHGHETGHDAMACASTRIALRSS
jgi:hypothetical protein